MREVVIEVTCQCGDCGLLWKPKPGQPCPVCALRTKMNELAAQWRKNADMLAEGNKDEWYDPSAGMQRSCADDLEKLAKEREPFVSAFENLVQSIAEDNK